MLAFLFLSWTGYCVDIQCSNGSDAEIEPRTIYICLVISKMGTEGSLHRLTECTMLKPICRILSSFPTSPRAIHIIRFI